MGDRNALSELLAFPLFGCLCRTETTNGRPSQSYHLADKIMPTAAVIMKNAKSTFGILPGSQASLKTGNEPRPEVTGQANEAYQTSEA